MERWSRIKERSGEKPSADAATILAAEAQHGAIIYATNQAARLAGIAEGAKLVDVKAVCSDLHVEYADIAGDTLALKQLMLWTRRWCPWTVVDGKDGLILESTGADHLWGGEAQMLDEIEARLSSLGMTARLAIAPTWGAAWALARYGPVKTICPKDEIAEMLAPLPASGLRLDAETLILLHRLGLKTIGALAKVPRLSLTRRFIRAKLDGNPLLRLDQAMGYLAEPVASVEALPKVKTQVRLADPIQDPTHHLPRLCADLCVQLTHRDLGCRRLHLTVYRTDGEISTIAAATSAPTRDADHLQRLFDDKLERIDPGFGFDLITLEASVVEPIAGVQNQLDGKVEDDLALPQLIDRLTAKFGPHAVRRPVLHESHVPERAEIRVAALHDEPLSSTSLVAEERPIRLLSLPEEVQVVYAVPEGPPAQFIWRRQTCKVVRYTGPERIAPEWWADRANTRLRDYYKIEDQSGKRLWLYREGLHDDGRGGDPRWFVHGMFA